MKNLIEFNGLYFADRTASTVQTIICDNLKNKRENRLRLRFWYENNKTGKSWNEENDVCGYIGQSTGDKKIPLLINKSSSFGGGALMTDCIVKIVDTKTKKVLYQHENFNQSKFIVRTYDCAVLANNTVHARGFKTEKQAQRYADFMNGKRMNK